MLTQKLSLDGKMGNLTAQLEQNMEVVAELRNLNKLRPFLFILLLAEYLEKYFLIHNMMIII